MLHRLAIILGLAAAAGCNQSATPADAGGDLAPIVCKGSVTGTPASDFTGCTITISAGVDTQLRLRPTRTTRAFTKILIAATVHGTLQTMKTYTIADMLF